MSLLSYNQLCNLVEAGVIEDIEHSQINSSSIDITLGDLILEEVPFSKEQKYAPCVSLREREPLQTTEFRFPNDEQPFFLYPQQFILAQSKQKFHLPRHISAEYKLKSSMARIGLEHLNAGWCDAGWNGSVLTLELKNMTQNHIITLHRGVGIGQMVFFQHEEVPFDRSYAARGRYNGDEQVSGIKE